MAKVQVKVGSAARKELFFALDSASTTGAGKTGASGTMTAYYIRNETAPTATQITSPAFTEPSSGFMPGVYYLTVPVGAFASGATTCAVMITGTGIAPVLMEYQLVAYDPDSATNLGLSALPTASPNATNGLITNGSGTGQLTVSGGVASSNTTQWNGTVVTALPTGFLSATFPSGTVANTTNITAGTITTVSGNVSGNVVGSVNSVVTPVTVGTINANVITNASIADSAIDIRRSTDGTTSKARLIAGAAADDVWNALVASYTTNTTFGYRLLRSDATSHSGDVQVSGNGSANNHNRVDSDVHALDSDHTAATNLKNALIGVAGTIITATLTALDSAERTAIADALLARDIGSGTNAGTLNERTVRSALRALRNKSSISGSTLTVTTENDTNIAWTAGVSSDAAAVPVTGIDPT